MLAGQYIFNDTSIARARLKEDLSDTRNCERSARFLFFSTNHLFKSIRLFCKMQISISKAQNVETLILIEGLLS